MHRPFRFGVIASTTQSRQTWISTVRRAEELGYTTLLAWDNPLNGLASFTALTMAIEATTSMHVGCFAFCNDYRHPALLTREVAMLDLLSEGRFEFGIGTGRGAAYYTSLGLPFETAGIRISRLEEALHILKGLFTEEKVNFSGTYYTLTNMKGVPKPFQKPHPPIHIHGASKRMLTLAAREADIVGIEPKLMDTGIDSADVSLEQKIAWIREAAGERFTQIELCRTAFDLWPTDGPIKVLVGGNFPFIHMCTDQIVTYLLDQRADLGISYIQIIDVQMENFAPIVAQLAGK